MLDKTWAPVPAPSPVVANPSPWWLRGALGIAAAVGALVLVLYHPPRLVVTPGQAIDVVKDIRIQGAPARRPSGKYLLLTVRVTQPNLAGYLLGLFTGQTIVGVDPEAVTPADRAAVERAGRAQYVASQHTAVKAALAVLGLDGRGVSVTIRDRGIVGPSAGLVYALAISDMIGRGPTTGRGVIAATGALDPDGTVEAVGWVTLKAQEAADAGAEILLVPAGEQPAADGRISDVVGVTSVAEAIYDLEHQR
jgi:PDZ domain-containing protein